MSNFWLKLAKPFFILAPMEDVTDTVFRQIIARAGRPDVFFTEFVNVDGLCSKGRSKIIHRLQYTEAERPIVAQIWGLKPENFYTVAKRLGKMGFDGIDINFGCPEKNVISQGACAALIENKSLATEIIQATLNGAGKLPVSVKTRIGISKIVTEEWISYLLNFPLAAITIHGRTAKEMSDVPAHWDEIGKAVKVRNNLKSLTLIIGNGDVSGLKEAELKVKQFGVDGVMIGRGIFHDPWLFRKTRGEHSVKDRLELLSNHTKLFVKTWGSTKNFSIMKKFFKIYCHGFSGASELRVRLMQCKSIFEVEQTIREQLTINP